MAVLRERCARFEEPAEYRGMLLADARTQMLIAELATAQRTTEALARALPPGAAGRSVSGGCCSY